MLLGWRPEIDWRFYGDLAALLAAIVFAIFIAYQFENGWWHEQPTVINVDTGLLQDQRTGPGINWGGRAAHSPPSQTLGP